MYCDKCGAQLAPEMSFCPNCGARINGDPVPQQSDAAVPVQQQSDTAVPVQQQSDTAVPAPQQSDAAVSAPQQSDAAVSAPQQSDVAVPIPQQGGYTGPIPQQSDVTAPIPQQGGYTGPIPQQNGYTGPIPQQNGYTAPIPQQGGYHPSFNTPIRYQTPTGNGYGSYLAQNAVQPPRQQEDSKAIAALKRLAGSPLFLIATIAVSISFLFSLFSSIINSSGFLISLTWLDSLFPQLNFSEMFRDDDAATALSVISCIISLIPAMLIVIGLWLTFGAAKSRGRRMSTAGVSMVKTVCIIKFVFLCIAFGILLIVMTVNLIVGEGFLNELIRENAYSARTAVGTITSTVIILFTLLIAAFVLMILYYAKLFGTINAVKLTARTGKASDQASGFVAVMNFLAVSVLLFWQIGSLAAASNRRSFYAYYSRVNTAFATYQTFSLISTVSTITALVLFGVLIFLYRGAMRRAKEE